MTHTQLILKYLDNDLTPKEAKELECWLMESPDNMEELRGMREADISLRYDATRQAADTKLEWRKFRRNVSSGRSVWLMSIAAAAVLAVFVVGAAFGAFLVGRRHMSPVVSGWEIAVETSFGEKATTVLPDGSTVRLNACSRLSYNPSSWDEQRSVRLVGQGAFSVVHDEDRAFVVNTACYQVAVLGTEFDVLSYPGSNEDIVSLKSGLVTIRIEGGDDVQLSPGSSLLYDNRDGSHSVVGTDEDFLSWESDEIRFDEENLRSKMDELYRHYGYTFDIDPSCDSDKLHATVRDESLVEFLSIIEAVSPGFHYSIDDVARSVSVSKSAGNDS